MNDVTERSDFAYDRVPYPGAADGLIQLRNLEVTATLFGLKPADIKKSRVLEIGCADGVNLLPFAVEFPESTFVGIDLAAQQIQRAADLAQHLQLHNIEFHAANVTDCSARLPSDGFDYILVPGVFSWITDTEREALLHVLQQFLAPNGVAAVSFNVLPGWSFREPLREFISRHVRAFSEPAVQVAEARRAVRFLAEASAQTAAHQKLYEEVHRIFESASDHYIFHDYISDRNQPFYFHEFVTMLTDHQLQFVAECDICHTVGLGLGSVARTVVDQSPVPDREQLIDFITGTAYRRAMVCHQTASVTRRLDHSSMTGLHLALVQKFPDLPVDLTQTDPWHLEYSNGTLSTTEPLGKAAIQILNELWPMTRTAEQLYHDACKRLPTHLHHPGPHSNVTTGNAVLAQSMLAAYAAGAVQVFKTPPKTARWPPPSASPLPEEHQRATSGKAANVAVPINRPQTSRLLQRQAAVGGRLVNFWHHNVDVHPDERFVLSILDGRRDLPAVASELQEYLRKSTPAVSAVDSTERLEQILERLSTARLLQNA
ncbi:MAG: class I SAM-dependent methyltransferase [Planctomycetaceae bacterium]